MYILFTFAISLHSLVTQITNAIYESNDIS